MEVWLPAVSPLGKVKPTGDADRSGSGLGTLLFGRGMFSRSFLANFLQRHSEAKGNVDGFMF